MDIAFQKHWLEDTVGQERDPVQVAVAIAARPEFIGIIRESVEFADKRASSNATRVIAEHIASTLYREFEGFTTMH